MGLGCGKAHLPKEEEVILGRKDRYDPQKDAQEGASGQEGGQASPPKRKKKQGQAIDDILKRANAGGTQERIAAALAASGIEGDGPAEEDDRTFMALLAGPGPAGGAGKSAPSRSSGPARAAGPSPATVHAARHGVPLPAAEEDDEAYGLLDEYVDDLLGIPQARRPNDWKRPSIKDTEASLQGATPQIIFGDGRRGPPKEAMPPRESLQEELGPMEVPRDQRPSLVPPPGATAAAGARGSTPYMSGVITGWASIDAQAVNQKVAGGEGPEPRAARGAEPEARAAGAPAPASGAKELPKPASRAAEALELEPEAVELRVTEDRRPAPKRKATHRKKG